MKKYLILCFVCLTSMLFSQEVSISRKLISENNWKSKGGVSIEINPTLVTREITGSKLNSLLELTFGAQFSRESRNSVLGFTTEVNFGFESLTVNNNAGLIDSINVTKLKIPAYMKINIGSVNADHQRWLAVGGGYAFQSHSAVSTYYNKNTLVVSKKYNNIIQASPYISSMMGFEKLGASDFILGRIYYIRLEYYLKERFNRNLNFDKEHVLHDRLDDVFLNRLNIHFGFALTF